MDFYEELDILLSPFSSIKRSVEEFYAENSLFNHGSDYQASFTTNQLQLESSETLFKKVRIHVVVSQVLITTFWETLF